MTKLEKEIEQKLRDMVKARGGKCLKWVCPGWSGVPDRIVLMPGSRVYFVELKKPKGGKPSELQKKWAKWLRELGFDVYFVYNYTDIETFDLILTNSGRRSK